MPAPMLTAQDSAGHVHLIVGSNPLASARCAKSIEFGAKPKIIAPADAEIHYVLMKRIEIGEVQWINRMFQDDDLKTLGRGDVENVVDAVFVTLSGKAPLSKWATGRIVQGPMSNSRRYAYFVVMQTFAHTRQRDGRSESQYFHHTINSLRRTSTRWNHHIW